MSQTKQIKQLATLQELLDAGWITTRIAQEQYNVPRYTVYRWKKFLLQKGLGEIFDVSSRGLWLISPEGLSFLQSRRDKRGRPTDGESKAEE